MRGARAPSSCQTESARTRKVSGSRVESASVQVVGVLLIFALLILPAAAAQQLTAQPSHAILLAVVLAVAYVWAGLLIGFYLPYPPSFFITTLAFLAFVGVRVTHQSR